MAKTRFQKLAKKDRDYVSQYVSDRPEMEEPLASRFDCERRDLAASAVALQTEPPAPGIAYRSVRDFVVSTLFFLSGEVTERCIAKRLLEDDSTALVSGLQLVSRLRYIQNLATTPEDSGGYDCLHVYEVLTSLAANDQAILPAYMNRYNSVSKEGHPWTKLLCNGVMMLLRKQVDPDTVQKLHDSKAGSYDKSALLALAAIAEQKPDELTEHLEAMLKLHRRKTLVDGLLRFFSIHVHGMFNLARLHFETTGVELPSPPASAIWDEGFHQAVFDQPFAFDSDLIGTLASQFAEWAIRLPLSVNDAEFTKLFVGNSTV